MTQKIIDIKGTKFPMEIIIHEANTNAIIINLPGYGGDIDGYDKKYEKLAKYITENKLAAVVRMANVQVVGTDYGKTLSNALRSAIEYAIKNSIEICGYDDPNIYLIGTSAGGGAVALVAHEYTEIQKILLVCPAGGNVGTFANPYDSIKQFTGGVSIVIGENDEVVGVDSGQYFASAAKVGNAEYVEFIIIPNCNHNFTGEVNGRILSRAPFWAFGTDIVFPHYTDSCKLYDDVEIKCENCMNINACMIIKQIDCFENKKCSLFKADPNITLKK